MNKVTLTVCASLVLGGLITAVQAQDNKPKPNTTGVAPAAPTTPANPTVVTRPGVPPGAVPAGRPMMADRTEMYARMLNLTEDQKTKVRPILDEEAKKMQEIREQTQEKMKAILTPEQWQKYYRPSPRADFSSRMQTIVSRTNGPAPTPVVPPAATPR